MYLYVNLEIESTPVVSLRYYYFNNVHMIVSTWSQVLTSSFQSLWTGVVQFIPTLIVALVIVLIGWFIGMLVGKAIEQFIKAIKLDEALKKLLR